MLSTKIRCVRKRVSLLVLICFYIAINSQAFGQYADIGQDPLKWLSEPHSVFSTEVNMSVKRPDVKGDLEFKFECVEGKGFSSEWQSANEFKNSGLSPETPYKFIARVRKAGSNVELLPPTDVYRVVTRRCDNTKDSRYMPEIDRAFAKGEIELIPIRVTGDKDNRINFCAINRWVEGKPEGYNTPELREEFIEDVKHSFRTFIPGDMYAIDPYPEYRDFFNLYAIWWPGMPAYDWKKGLTTVDLDEIRDRLFLPWNVEGKAWVTCLAMLNTDKGGGGAARNIETRTGNAMIAGKETEAFIHEFSHTAPGLPDEYTSNGVWGRGGEGSNTTLDYILDDVKWRAWIEPGTEVPTPYSPENLDKVGVFEGATHRLHHIYRPTARGCIMGAGSFAGDPDGLCPVCVQRTVCRLYMWVNPFDSIYPARQEFSINKAGKVHFAVEKINNLSGTQKLTWILNGEVIAGDVTEIDITLNKSDKYVLECRMIDETDFVRPDLPYVDYPVASVSWAINNPKSASGGDILKNNSTDTGLVVHDKNNWGKGQGIDAVINELIPSTGNNNNGGIRIKVNSEGGPYSFKWSDGESGDSPSRDFLTPGRYSVEISNSGNSFAYLDFEITKVPAFLIEGLQFESSKKGKIRISNPKSEYQYLWYKKDIPDYVPKFPNGKFYGSGRSSDGKEFKAVATVVENRGGVFIKDTAKNDFGSWIFLKVYPNGENELPVEFSINTSQDGRFADTLYIKDQKTEKIVYDDNFRFSTEELDITWNGIIKDGYLELEDLGYLNSKMRLYYSSYYANKKEPIAIGKGFEPVEAGNYYIAAQQKESGAISVNRLGLAVPEFFKRDKIKPIDPSEIVSSKLLMWLDGTDLDADGRPDGKLFRRGSANGAKSKTGNIDFHFFNYFPNAQNGKPVLSWETIWVQRLSKEVNNYQTIIMVRKENDLSSSGTAPWRELDTLIGIGDYGKKLFDDNISPNTTNGRVWVNSERVDPWKVVMPKDFYIVSYEFSERMDNPFKTTDGHWEGEVTEVLVFSSKLTGKERKGIEEYLYRKWISGLTY